jgi:hypothetical protein
VGIPEKSIDIVTNNQKARQGCIGVRLRHDIVFDTEELERFAFASWKPLIYDAMVVAASIEYADRIVLRPASGWARSLSLSVPVNEYELWSSPEVMNSLHDAIRFLTGDCWNISFKMTTDSWKPSRETLLSLRMPVNSILAFSDGMDSHIVSRIMESEGEKLLRVRMKRGSSSQLRWRSNQEEFVTVPYSLKFCGQNKTTSLRSRGFKFAMIGGIASYLTNVEYITIPESGQGAVGPALVPLGHMYPDYRSHPFFTKRMERLLKALFQRNFCFHFPRIWNTKGETLKEFTELPGVTDTWKNTRSCWKDSRWSSVKKEHRQCGTCAACLFRRVSVHAAGLTEEANTYICTNMNASTFEAAVEPGFSKLTKAFKQHAIAGVLSMDNLSELANQKFASSVQRQAMLLGYVLDIPRKEAEEKLTRLLYMHAQEWKGYVNSLGPESYIKKLVRWN